jgi:hypothetical protein
MTVVIGVAPMSTYVARGIFQEDLEVVRAVFFRISVIPVLTISEN